MSSTVNAEPIKVFVHNSQLNLPVDPVIIDGRTLVPLRAIFEALGATVEWDQATKTVTGIQGDKLIKLQVDNKIAQINGQEVTLDAAATIVNGSTLVPVRFIAETLGANVNWDNNSRSVLVNSDIPKVPVATPTPAPAPIISTPAPAVGPSSGMFKGSVKSDKYHYPTYTHNGQIADHNLIWFESREDAESKGYKPCGICFR
ncbi:copper amine oxidase N-terminal domain-containing protein [Tissierella creatinini]|nr:copper amine oxidase N-terminal domain-containing protein [Tissierella creatinini]TJX60091.1 copper amine oxidase N-terminal domain-containing protein [Soehngenia saccharolytica]